MNKRDYYEVLGVERSADEATVKSAYRKLAMRWHPDKNHGDAAAEAKFKEVGEAYQVLSDKDKRARYDQYGHGADAMGAGASADDIFSRFAQGFGGGFGGFDFTADGGFDFDGMTSQGRRGEDLRVDVELEFLEAALGGRKSVSFEKSESCRACAGCGSRSGSPPAACPACRGRGQTPQASGFFQVQVECEACAGSGQVTVDPCAACSGKGLAPQRREIEIKVPAGITEGMSQRIRGEGQPGDPGAPPGDLICVARIKPHPRFSRDKNDVVTDTPIMFTTAILGGWADVATLEGSMKVDVKPGTQHDTRRVIRGLGIADVRSKKRGDLVVRFSVQVPKKLTGEQETLLRKLADSLETTS